VSGATTLWACHETINQQAGSQGVSGATTLWRHVTDTQTLQRLLCIAQLWGCAPTRYLYLFVPCAERVQDTVSVCRSELYLSYCGRRGLRLASSAAKMYVAGAELG
jgi:hypothetical protein